MPNLSGDIVLKKFTKITLGMGIFSFALLFIALPIPGAAILGEILMILGLIQISRGFLSIGKEKIRGNILYLASGSFLLILIIFITIEFVILFLYVSLGLDIVSYLAIPQSTYLGSNSVTLGINLAKIILILSAITTLLFITSFASLEKELQESSLRKDSILLFSLIFFLITLYFSLDAITNIDGYLRPLLFFILNLYSESNHTFLAIGLATLSLSIYAILKIYIDIGKVIQREVKKKYNLPY